MTASCSCLKLCSMAVALANLCLGLYILIEGIFVLVEYLTTKVVTIGLILVYFQIATFLLFVSLLLLIGIIQDKEKYISLYLLLSSLIWFIVTMLVVSYMLFYNTTAMTHNIVANETTTTPAPVSGTPAPKETVPAEKAVGFSIGLVLIWCGQLGVYKFHDQVIEKNIINAGQSYVSSAMNS
ncbi:hypothetical protein Zmor_009469 [Zophobas morio]|uniref:Uncharacterized protein n=1 Tax=Zophobas morio TaxID=2755281 RepID=A0AA38MIQ3_9CUCU|nr:hypothetical protein Zmor_009469 [Zophobas morio]